MMRFASLYPAILNQDSLAEGRGFEPHSCHLVQKKHPPARPALLAGQRKLLHDSCLAFTIGY